MATLLPQASIRFTGGGGGPRRARIEMIKHLICIYGLDPNEMDNVSLDTMVRGSMCGTPLHHAVDHGYLLRAEWLFKHGADPHRATSSVTNPSMSMPCD